MPAAIPAMRGAVNRSSSHSAESRTLNSGAAALRIAEYDAGRCSAANANSRNGSAELRTPMTRKWRQCRRRPPSKPARRNPTTSAMPAIITRESAVSTGPSTGASVRMKMNDAPQIAARRTRRTMSLPRTVNALSGEGARSAASRDVMPARSPVLSEAKPGEVVAIAATTRVSRSLNPGYAASANRARRASSASSARLRSSPPA